LEVEGRNRVLCVSSAVADAREVVPYTIAPGLFDAARPDMGLRRAEGSQTVAIFKPDAATDKFSNGVVLMPFKGKLYAQWQSSRKDEDSPDTWVAYSVSADGAVWSQPAVLAPAWHDASMHSSGGWWTDGETLVAHVNVWPSGFQSGEGGYTEYRLSTDGRHCPHLSAS
jgi:hypothetical protein